MSRPTDMDHVDQATKPTSQRHWRIRRYLLVAIAVIVVSLSVGYLTRYWWLPAVGQALVCESSDAPSDAILIDFVAHDYHLFERARILQDRALASSVLIPVAHPESSDVPASLLTDVANLLCNAARVPHCITFDAPFSEPISLNLARRSAEELRSRKVRSILLVTGGFRSRRAASIYAEVLRPYEIQVHCQPVFGSYTPSNWYVTMHGMQEVGLQFLKAWYYRAFVLRSN